MTVTCCAKCKVVYEERSWLVINNFHLHLCTECMQYFQDKIVKEIQK